jgi:hypothetical protein
MLASAIVGEDDPQVIELDKRLNSHLNDNSAVSPGQVVNDNSAASPGQVEWFSPIRRLLHVFC